MLSPWHVLFLWITPKLYQDQRGPAMPKDHLWSKISASVWQQAQCCPGHCPDLLISLSLFFFFIFFSPTTRAVVTVVKMPLLNLLGSFPAMGFLGYKECMPWILINIAKFPPPQIVPHCIPISTTRESYTDILASTGLSRLSILLLGHGILFLSGWIL